MEIHFHDREKTTGVSMRPVCNECGHILDYLAYNPERGSIIPSYCDKCGRAIASFTIEGVSLPDKGGDIYFATPKERGYR